MVVIDYGSSISALTQKIGADLAIKGAGMIGAPLGRTPTHAKDGLLNTMAVCEIETYEKVKPVLDVQGENVFQLGALDAWHTTKPNNNFMCMTTACTMSQAFVVVQKAGIDGQQLFDIMLAGPFNSPFMQFCKNYAEQS